MGRAVNLVVSCSNRKRYETAPGLAAGALESGGVQRRLRAWGKRLNDARVDRHPAEDVYMGEHWSVARNIPAEAKEFGWSVRLWICSAGYGLIRPSTKIRAYQATFARGTEDFVAPGTDDQEPIQAWWAGACAFDLLEEESFPRSLAALAQAYPRTPLVVALSADYLNAIEQDLRGVLEYSYFERQLSIISCGMRANHPHWKDNLLPCDGRLSASLGGTFTSLNTRIARFLLRSSATSESTVEHFRGLVRSIEGRTKPQLSRVAQSDREIEKFIQERLMETPPASKTRLLEQFRAAGKACEQKRFGELYQRLRWEAQPNIHG
jgi:hypothetical protein